MLIGRARELDRVSRALAEEHPFFVVTGAAGVGKTSLLRTAIAASGRPLLEGEAFATLAWIPFYPLSRAFSEQISDGDPAYVAAEIEQRMAEAAALAAASD
jgi:ABC-type cobalamin/Fe3+-siderophores transport system ATPase subunit